MFPISVTGYPRSGADAEYEQGESCRVELLDYRDIGEAESYDKIVSVGMFEHVGRDKLPEYFSSAWHALRPGGAFLNHGIACGGGGEARSRTKSRRPSFNDRYVFPDGELVPINVALSAAEETGFEVRDVESLREHYTLTLRRWVRRREAKHKEAKLATDEATDRVWRLFMSASAYGFSSGRINVYQTLLTKPDGGESGLPLTRQDWYSDQGISRSSTKGSSDNR
ncbi:MAG: hypothetical protein C4521_01105 [Actinobacteria bacterium]|nr:MAG: hypothetical protein C4521_01105 [Actinomycetota bacterium]